MFDELAEERPYIAGEVMAIFFQNPTNFYKVMLVHIAEKSINFPEDEIVVTGSFGDIQEDERYRFWGQLVDHPRYGRQFQVESYQQDRPTSASGVVNISPATSSRVSARKPQRKL